MTQLTVQYDYTNQAWLRDGVYQKCGHLECRYIKMYEKECYGSKHEGERGQQCEGCSEWNIVDPDDGLDGGWECVKCGMCWNIAVLCGCMFCYCTRLLVNGECANCEYCM